MKFRLMLFTGLLLLAGSLHAQTDTPTATPEATSTPLTLTLWLPDLLAAPDNAAAREELNRQIEMFTAAHPGVQVAIRLKRVGDVGGIMSTLRAASTVAPGALPDLTLIRRQDLVSAVRDGLIQSLEGKVPSAVLGGLDTALKLGQVNNQLFGVPYMLELQHLVYRVPPGSSDDYASWSYAAVLERGEPFVFPAGKTTGISEVLFLQYLASGGTLSGEGTLTLNAAAVRTTLDFYEQAREKGIVSDSLLNYPDALAYLTAFATGEDIHAAVFSSTLYLQLLKAEPGLRAASIPSEQGGSISLLNGWLWVLVSSVPEKQDAALQFLNTVMLPENQMDYARAVNMLPAARQAMLDSLPVRVDKDLYTSLLDSAVLPLTESEGGTLARALQEGFSAVISGQQTAEQAARAIENQSG